MSRFIPILAYHSLDPGRFPNNKLAISPQIFRQQMLLLKKWGFKIVTLESCARGGWTEGFLDRKAAITFDDGYADNYRWALPVLKEFGFAATFFATPQDIGQEGFMNWDMLREMAEVPGIEIGSHGLEHRPLSDIPEKEAWISLVASKKILEEQLGREVSAISYPSGSFNEKIVEMAQGAGYAYGCAASHIHDRKFIGNPYLLRRIKISSSSQSAAAFALRLSGFYHSFGRP
ncbi:MAG TPA: polysaccharide deacetylase family protein [Candidatus Omnitrophota bacterium]|nr:polysaccharide deacetylase family protein [Candidatus Omnitrophota bacterium]HRY85766.1 polysaccharide deacetylase family protein [Candidatus Omnitrophota bacterium]